MKIKSFFQSVLQPPLSSHQFPCVCCHQIHSFLEQSQLEGTPGLLQGLLVETRDSLISTYIALTGTVPVRERNPPFRSPFGRVSWARNKTFRIDRPVSKHSRVIFSKFVKHRKVNWPITEHQFITQHFGRSFSNLLHFEPFKML